MSIELKNLIESIEILNGMRAKSSGIDFAWNMLYNAGKHLQKQVAEHLAE